MARTEQILRQWKILQRLAVRPGGMTVNDLAEGTGVSWETVHRDLELLSGYGFPLFDEAREGLRRWRFIDGYALRIPLPLTLPELAALRAASFLLSLLEDSPFVESYQSLRQKVEAALPTEAREFLDRLQKGLEPPFASGPGRRRALIQKLRQAAAEHRTIELRYFSKEGEETMRRVDPLRVWHAAGEIVLVGFCHLARRIAAFPLDRLHRLRDTEETFEPPPAGAVEDYVSGSLTADLLAELHEVRVRFVPAVAELIASRVWHPTQSLHSRDDGAIDLAFRVAELRQAARFILAFGRSARALAPRSLVLLVSEELGAAADSYAVRVEGEEPPAEDERQLSLLDPLPE